MNFGLIEKTPVSIHSICRLERNKSEIMVDVSSIVLYTHIHTRHVCHHQKEKKEERNVATNIDRTIRGS